jgi:hypothetical protein
MLADRLDGKVPQPVGGSDLGPQRLHISWGTHQHHNGALAAAAINQEVIDYAQALRNRVSVPARRISKKSAATSSLEAGALTCLKERVADLSECARQGWPMSPRLEKHAARTSRSNNAVPKVAFRK